MDFKVYLGMAVLAFSATEVFKAVANVYKPELKIGLVLALFLGLSYSIGYGTGLVSAISGVEYNTVLFPMLFMTTDLVCTGAVLSLGSKGINMVLEYFNIDVSGGIKNEIEKYLADKVTKE